jgi:uncharacterized protein YndB with AHSA1/START domain
MLDAPCQRVFGAFADPERLARWWGPAGFSSSFQQFEFRPGRRWLLSMHGPDGAIYMNESVFAGIAEPSRIVIERLRECHHFVLETTLEAHGDQTRVGWRKIFDTVEHRDQVAEFVMVANERVLDRLAAEVGDRASRE